MRVFGTRRAGKELLAQCGDPMGPCGSLPRAKYAAECDVWARPGWF